MNPDQWITSFSTLIKSVARAILNKRNQALNEEVQFSPEGLVLGCRFVPNGLEPNYSTFAITLVG
jgi:hypothetical protein